MQLQQLSLYRWCHLASRLQPHPPAPPPLAAPPEPETEVSPVVAHVKTVIDKISSSINNQEQEKRTGGPREIIRSPPALIPDEHPPPQQQPLQLTNKQPETTSQSAVSSPPSSQVTSPGTTPTTPITIAPRSTPDDLSRPGPPPLIGTRPPAHSGGIPTQSSPSKTSVHRATATQATGVLFRAATTRGA